MHPIDTDPTLRALLIEYQRVRDHNLKASDQPGDPAFPIAEGTLALTPAECF